VAVELWRMATSLKVPPHRLREVDPRDLAFDLTVMRGALAARRFRLNLALQLARPLSDDMGFDRLERTLRLILEEI
jgi:hypothetical protein